MTRSHLLVMVSLLFASGCHNCGEKEEAAPTNNKPEPPVVVHPKLPDGGRGKARIVDIAEHPSPFEAGADPP